MALKKHRRFIILSVLIVVGIGLFTVRQISTEGIQLDPDESLEKAVPLNRPDSLSSLRFGGIKKKRAHFHSWRMDRFLDTIEYWTPLEEFDEKTQRKIEGGLGPWKTPTTLRKPRNSS